MPITTDSGGGHVQEWWACAGVVGVCRSGELVQECFISVAVYMSINLAVLMLCMQTTSVVSNWNLLKGKRDQITSMPPT